MKYMGSKRRIQGNILPLILKNRTENQFYVEPFMGGCNSLCEVNGNRIGNDYNEYVSEMWKALVNGWVPPDTITEKQFNEIKNNKEQYEKHLVGFVGVSLTFGSKWFGTFARNSRGTNYAIEGRSNLYKQVDKLKGVIFRSESYDSLDIPEKSIIYCDPPYEGVTGYKDKFNHLLFWEWCRKMSSNGHLIFISEYNAPNDFKCIWEMELKTNLDASVNKSSIEKLFVHESQIHLI